MHNDNINIKDTEGSRRFSFFLSADPLAQERRHGLASVVVLPAAVDVVCVATVLPVPYQPNHHISASVTSL